MQGCASVCITELRLVIETVGRIGLILFGCFLQVFWLGLRRWGCWGSPPGILAFAPPRTRQAQGGVFNVVVVGWVLGVQVSRQALSHFPYIFVSATSPRFHIFLTFLSRPPLPCLLSPFCVRSQIRDGVKSKLSVNKSVRVRQQESVNKSPLWVGNRGVKRRRRWRREVKKERRRPGRAQLPSRGRQ